MTDENTKQPKRFVDWSTKTKEVVQIDRETNEIIATFKSAAQAARFLQGHRTAITQTCKGTRPSAHGYAWKYADAV